jgi:hypothetical protein
LRYFFETAPQAQSLDVLDLGDLSESNVNFLSERGARIHAVDLVAAFDRSSRDRSSEPFDPEAARDFIDEYLNYNRSQFDAILAWDSLEFLDVEVLHMVAPRLQEVLRPGGALLSLFHTQSRGQDVQRYRYRIQATDALELQPKQIRRLPNTFNNRSLERLFGDFQSVKFFLTRDSLREVIVAR